jgi:hypothetical protein
MKVWVPFLWYMCEIESVRKQIKVMIASLYLFTAPSVVRLGPYPPASVPRLPPSFFLGQRLARERSCEPLLLTTHPSRTSPLRTGLEFAAKAHNSTQDHTLPYVFRNEKETFFLDQSLASLAPWSCIRSRNIALLFTTWPQRPHIVILWRCK